MQINFIIWSLLLRERNVTWNGKGRPVLEVDEKHIALLALLCLEYYY